MTMPSTGTRVANALWCAFGCFATGTMAVSAIHYASIGEKFIAAIPAVLAVAFLANVIRFAVLFAIWDDREEHSS